MAALSSRRGMTGYRLYLRNASGIVGRDDFDASDDETAATMAELISEACSDECDHYELWQGMRCLSSRRTAAPRPPKNATEIVAEMKDSLIAREEAIQNSRWAVARSRRLLERLNALRQDDTR
jgi:hypothetical protein